MEEAGCTNENLKGRKVVRFKAHRTELAEDKQENVWAKVMTTKLSLTPQESGSNVKNRLAAPNPEGCRQTSGYRASPLKLA